MGYFSNLAIEVVEARAQGATIQQLAQRFEMSESDVEAVLEMMDEADCDPVPFDYQE